MQIDLEVTDVPLSKTSSQEVKHIVSRLFLSTVFSSLCEITPALTEAVTIYFISKNLKIEELGYMSLCLGWANIFGAAISSGITIGYSIMAAQLFGAQNARQFAIAYQKTKLTLLGVLVFLILMVLILKPVLGLFHFTAMEKDHLFNVALSMLVFVFGFQLSNLYKAKLNALNFFSVPTIISFLGMGINWTFSKLFIEGFQWGLVGASLSLGFTYVLQGLIAFMYYKLQNPFPEAEIGWQKESFSSQWKDYFKQMFIMGFISYINWIALDQTLLVLLISGHKDFLSPNSLVINAVAFALQALGNIPLIMYVGQFAGEGAVQKARKVSNIGLIISLTISGLLFFVLLFCRRGIISIYTDAEGVITYAAEMLQVYSYAFVLDCMNEVVNGILRALNILIYTTYCQSFGYFGISFTLGLGLTFTRLSHLGQWVAFDIGAGVALILTLMKYWTLNWDEQVKEVAIESVKVYQLFSVSPRSSKGQFVFKDDDMENAKLIDDKVDQVKEIGQQQEGNNENKEALENLTEQAK